MVRRDHRIRTPPSVPVESEQRDRLPLRSLCRVRAPVTPDPTSMCAARQRARASDTAAGPRGGSGRVSSMVTARSPKTHHLIGNGSTPRDAPSPRAAVFVDLDRTLLRGRERPRAERGHARRGALRGAAVAARRAHLLRALRPHGREPRLHGDGACRPALHPGMGGRGRAPRRRARRPRAGRARAALRAGRAGRAPRGRSPRRAHHHHAVGPRRPVRRPCSGFDHVLATRYGREEGRYTGGIDGDVRVGGGQAGRRPALGAGGEGRPVAEPRLLRQRVRPAPARARWGARTP